MTPWPWQTRAVNEVIRVLGNGELSICVTAPTGTGKGKMIEMLAMHFIDLGGKVILFTNRKMLTKQTGDRMIDAGIHFGYVSASHGIDSGHNMTVASIQTFRSRIAKQTLSLPFCDLVIVDECHRNDFDFAIKLYRKSHHGVSVVGFSASPVGLKGKYNHLIVACDKKEGRVGGALVPCKVIAPSEPDMKGVRMNKIGEYIHEGMVKRVMQCTVFADVFDTWSKCGQPRPTLLWAPGVPESRYFVSEFRKRGVTAEHIDGETPDKERDRIKNGSREGSVKIVSSFGVLREGIDWPWISYGILVQVCGAYETFVQLVGRILRSHPGKVDAILQDHSGTWWRHGSPNSDRSWSLDDTNRSIAKQRQKILESPKDKEPICCPRCHGIRLEGPSCPHCGYENSRSLRMVRTEDGELVAMEGDVVRKKRRKNKILEQSTWESCLFRCGSTGRTWRQAAGLFWKEAKIWAPNSSDCYPKPDTEQGWQMKIHETHPGYNRRRAYA